MTQRMFRLDPLGSALHNKKTLEIFSQIDKQRWSQFVRMSILEYAKELGYMYVKHEDKPEFLSNKQWSTFKHRVNRSKLVDYTFYLAFHWVKHQDKFQYIDAGLLLRTMIEHNSDNLIQAFNYSEAKELEYEEFLRSRKAAP